MPSDTHKHAPFPRTANSPSRLNSKFRDRIQDGCAQCDLKDELFSLCLDRFGGLNGNFHHSYYCNTLLRPHLCLCMAYSLPILERLVLCQCYRDNSFPGGVHVFLQRPSEIIKRLKCGRGVRSEIRVGSQRILERSITPSYI